MLLSTLDGITSKEDALRLVEDAEAATGAVIDLARMVCTGKGASWKAAIDILSKLEEAPETIRLTILAYASRVLLDAGNKNPEQCLAVVQAFSQPCNTSEGKALILLALGGLLLGG